MNNEETKVKFDEYGIEFNENEFAEMSKEDLDECEGMINQMKEILNRK